MIGIIVPAHNEQALIGACLAAALAAAMHPQLAGERVQVVVVLDGCSDATGILAARHGDATWSIRARDVGTARAVGAELVLVCGARWLAFTDADTRVARGWLAEQLALGADAVGGTVGVEDWRAHGENARRLRRHFARTDTNADGHRHLHGANLGLSANAYRRAGGFRRLACKEDVALVDALKGCGASIAWSARPRVLTSARASARACGGIADALLAAVAPRSDAPVNPTTSGGGLTMDWLDLVQWPAFIASLAAAWLVASEAKRRRNIGFWVFLLSNLLWTAWGLHTHAFALIALQLCLAALNIRGLLKTEPTTRKSA